MQCFFSLIVSGVGIIALPPAGVMMRSASRPSQPVRLYRMSLSSSDGVRTAAPAASPKMMQVDRSFQLTSRVSTSEPRMRQHLDWSIATACQPAFSAYMKPEQAAIMSTAPALKAPIFSCRYAEVDGTMRSGVEVAK